MQIIPAKAMENLAAQLHRDFSFTLSGPYHSTAVSSLVPLKWNSWLRLEGTLMAVDMFLKMTNIKGEAQDAKHKDEIEVLSWSWGAHQTGTTHTGTGGGAAKVSVQDLTFTHYFDRASCDLLKACCTGEHFKEAILTVRKASGKAQIEYIKIKLENIIITGVTTGGSHGLERLTENVSLNFQKFIQTYTQQMPDGTPGAKPQFGWDMARNKDFA